MIVLKMARGGLITSSTNFSLENGALGTTLAWVGGSR